MKGVGWGQQGFETPRPKKYATLMQSHYSNTGTESALVTMTDPNYTDDGRLYAQKYKGTKLSGWDPIFRGVMCGLTYPIPKKSLVATVSSSLYTHSNNVFSIASAFACGIIYYTRMGASNKFSKTHDTVQVVVAPENEDEYYQMLECEDLAEISIASPLAVVALSRWFMTMRKCKLKTVFKALQEQKPDAPTNWYAYIGVLWGALHGNNKFSDRYKPSPPWIDDVVLGVQEYVDSGDISSVVQEQPQKDESDYSSEFESEEDTESDSSDEEIDEPSDSSKSGSGSESEYSNYSQSDEDDEDDEDDQPPKPKTKSYATVARARAPIDLDELGI
jgi:hypothetical protein